MVEVTEPVTTIRLDTPAGLVVVDVAVEDGAAKSVTLRNVPVVLRRDWTAWSTCPASATVRYDLAYGGNFYAIVELDDLGLPFDRGPQGRPARRRAGDHGRDQRRRRRPSIPRTRRSPASTTSTSPRPAPTPATRRHAMAIHPGWFDRSPCGTGTSRPDGPAARPRRAAAATRTSSTSRSSARRSSAGWSRRRTVGGVPAVVPTITGRAWITGTAQYLLDPRDPFPEGFEL